METYSQRTLFELLTMLAIEHGYEALIREIVKSPEAKMWYMDMLNRGDVLRDASKITVLNPNSEKVKKLYGYKAVKKKQELDTKKENKDDDKTLDDCIKLVKDVKIFYYNKDGYYNMFDKVKFDLAIKEHDPNPNDLFHIFNGLLKQFPESNGRKGLPQAHNIIGTIDKYKHLIPKKIESTPENEKKGKLLERLYRETY